MLYGQSVTAAYSVWLNLPAQIDVITKKCVHETRLQIICCCLLFGFLVHSFSNCLPLRSRSVDGRFGFLVHATNWCNVSLAFWPFSPWFTRIVKPAGKKLTDRFALSHSFRCYWPSLPLCVCAQCHSVWELRVCVRVSVGPRVGAGGGGHTRFPLNTNGHKQNTR